VLGADTRATEGTVVRRSAAPRWRRPNIRATGGATPAPAGPSHHTPSRSPPRPAPRPAPPRVQISDKNCEKIHYIAPNIYCCGAGTAADTENVTKLISSQLELLRLQTGLESRVVTAMTQLKRRLFQYQGHVSAALVLGGVDVTGAHLYTIYPHGSTDKLPFVSMGSGSLAAMAVLESGYKDDMSEAEAIALVAASIRAGIFNDLGSGSNVDITVIRATQGEAAAAAAGGAGAGSSPTAAAAAGAAAKPASRVTVMRNYQTLNDVAPLRAKITRPASRHIPRGATVVLSESFRPAAAKKAAGGGDAAMAVDAGGAGAGGDRMDVS
jgi:20S proteasome alpha/beta subunit